MERHHTGRWSTARTRLTSTALELVPFLTMPMDDTTLRTLADTRTIDLTTFGRRSGRPSRIEIWWFHFDHSFIVTGTPGPRHWLANVRADPRVIIHVEDADHEARAVEVYDVERRRRFFSQTQEEVAWYRSQAELDRLVAEAPMIEIRFD